MCYSGRTPATAGCYQLTRWLFLVVLCPVPVSITSIAAAIGIKVKSDVTSNEVIHSPSSNLVFLISSANSLLLLTW